MVETTNFETEHRGEMALKTGFSNGGQRIYKDGFHVSFDIARVQDDGRVYIHTEHTCVSHFNLVEDDIETFREALDNE